MQGPHPTPIPAGTVSAPAAVQEIEIGEFTSGSVLAGTYRLVRRLDRGGMGDIHLASHERLPGEFVVKVLSPDLVGNEEALVRFRQEAVVMATLRHPNVVQLVDFNVTQGGRPYLVMEYLPGENLGELLMKRSFSAGEASAIVRQVACALDAAHQMGVVHRDLKPENIMVIPYVGQGELIKIIDFGISKARRFNHLTSNSMVMGTPEFMAPEQAEGRHDEVSASTDQFSLAVISYLLLTGRMPWGVNTPDEVLHCVVNEYPLALTDCDACRPIESVLRRGMASATCDRYPSTLAFWRALDDAIVRACLLPAQIDQAVALHRTGVDIHTASLVAAQEAARQAPERRRPTEQAPPRRQPAETPPAGVPARAPARARAGGQAGMQAGTKDRRPHPALHKIARVTRLGSAAVLLAALGCGYFLDGPAIRTHASGAWSALRSFASHSAEQGVTRGHRLMSKASKTREYLSLGSGQ
jgi:hypothetical protein